MPALLAIAILAVLQQPSPANILPLKERTGRVQKRKHRLNHLHLSEYYSLAPNGVIVFKPDKSKNVQTNNETLPQGRGQLLSGAIGGQNRHPKVKSARRHVHTHSPKPVGLHKHQHDLSKSSP